VENKETKIFDPADPARSCQIWHYLGKIQDLEESGLETKNGLENNMPESLNVNYSS
jgi:hypothetical protein